MIVSILLAIIVILVLYVGSHRLSGSVTAATLFVAVCGVALVVAPGLASKVATWVGVGRGTDLVLYFAIMGGLFISAHFYFQIKRHEEHISDLTRALALAQSKGREPVDAFPRSRTEHAHVK